MVAEKKKPKRLVYFPLRLKREADEERHPEKYVIKQITEDMKNKKIVNVNGDFFDH
jgi:hypothetical protein